LEMPVLNGSKTLDSIRLKFPKTKVVIISSYYDEELIKDHFNRGAMAYVSKKAGIDTVVAAIRKVHKGSVYKENIPELLKTKAVRDRHYYKILFTKREQEIIRLVCIAKNLKSVASELCISDKTVEAHLTEIYKKVNVKNKSEFLVYALKEGLDYLGNPLTAR
ncbi:MAG: LuxR C-terminal-related transcriptional regulator, partial [Bacteroidia bacterium]